MMKSKLRLVSIMDRGVWLRGSFSVSNSEVSGLLRVEALTESRSSPDLLVPASKQGHEPDADGTLYEYYIMPKGTVLHIKLGVGARLCEPLLTDTERLSIAGKEE